MNDEDIELLKQKLLKIEQEQQNLINYWAGGSEITSKIYARSQPTCKSTDLIAPTEWMNWQCDNAAGLNWLKKQLEQINE